MALTKVHNRMVENATFNVKDFGAVGDGVTDDRAAINAAFTAMAEAGGGTVFFPKATYKISNYIGNTTNPSAQISVKVIAELGTVIDSDPSSYADYAMYIAYPDMEHCYISGFRVNCNDKTARGIWVSSTGTAYEDAFVEQCQVYDCNAPDVPAATRSVVGIRVGSGGFSFRSRVKNCKVSGVSRDQWTGGQFVEGITLTDAEIMIIDGCTIDGVTHNSNQLQDADSIKVFSENQSGDYQKSTIEITNNHITDGDGRMIKLQTEGSVLVQNNYLQLSGSVELIQNWKGIDSQSADATVKDNYFVIDDNWTGGSSATLVQLQSPTSANVSYTNESFYQKFVSNNVESRKTMPYFLIASFLGENIAANQYVDVTDNRVNFATSFTTTNAGDNAFTHFYYTSSGPDPANVTGQMFWTFARNVVSTYNFIRFSFTQVDYTDKLFLQVYDNVKLPTGYTRGVLYIGPTSPYTSNIMIRDNQIGDNPGGLYNAPVDSTKIMNGCDFPTGDGSAGTISPAPANWRNGHFGKKGGVLFAETVASATPYRYISRDNGSNWYQV